ncbi:sugar kinase [Pectobacterium aquaticum]|uniref:sugar kinase n=2 Tax=Pectobacteriaceae TaxID=1903410 RepID=UPI000E230E26|nr:sugar kinase [Pectobacterium aquaticum]RRO06362.1 sugar kinase [Pectobacterium aquaticum]TAI86636.1 sugar kinase [Pectobacterium versatile]
MVMESPEIQLKALNNALRRLRGACSALDGEELDEKLLEVMRRLLLAEVLADTWIVAIGGSQGAGKTTLMASLYDLHYGSDGWLRSNEGRGEKMPVLILESRAINEPQGYVRRLVKTEHDFTLEDVEVDASEFQRAVCDPDAGDLLPVLKVPQRYFKRDNQAWLLLPGYEKQERENREWQELMRQAMIAAGGCIIVTDETRLANQQQLEIVKDMLEKELKNCKPYIVISKTEGYRHNPQRQSELRKSAAETFNVDAENTDNNIILTGSDDPEYILEWMPHLRRAIDDLNFSGQTNRYLQLVHLTGIVSKDLPRVMNMIRSQSRLYYHSDKGGLDDGSQVLAEVLEVFDSAVQTLREEHTKMVKARLATAFEAAKTIMDNKLVRDHEGFANWVSNAFDTTSETKGKLQRLVQNSWQDASAGFFNDYVNGLQQLTAPKLKPIPNGNEHGNLPAPPKLAKLIQLGYMDSAGRPVQHEQLDAEKVSNIKMLLNQSHTSNVQNTTVVNKQFRKSVELIPVLSLEYTRLVYSMPEICRELRPYVTLEQDDGETSAGNVAAEGVQTLSAGVDLGKTAIKSLAAVLAIDVVSDGDSDILGALFGQEQPSADSTGSPIPPAPVMLHPAAVAVTAVVAAAYVTVAAVTRMRTFEKKASIQAHAMLTSVYDHHVEHLRNQFDDTMNAARKRIIEALRARYHMDEMLMRKDRLAKAIADVNALIDDLRNELGSSASGLQVLISSRGE